MMRRALPLLVLLVACGGGARRARPRVAVTVAPLFDLARRVAGDRLDVVLVRGPTRNVRLAFFVGQGVDDQARRDVTSASPLAAAVTLAPPGQPHFWMDPVAARGAVDRMAAEFALLDPAGADGYRARAAQVKTQLASLDAALTARLQRWRGRTIAIADGDALAPFAARYGLTVVPAETPDAVPVPAVDLRTAGESYDGFLLGIADALARALSGS